MLVIGTQTTRICDAASERVIRFQLEQDVYDVQTAFV
jgi:hypothetical protein